MGRESLLEFFHDYFDRDAEYLIYDDGYRSRVTFGDPIRPDSEEPQRLAHELEEAVQPL